VTLLELGATCLWRAAYTARTARAARDRDGAVDTLYLITKQSPHAGLRRLAAGVLASPTLNEGESNG
jgi:hypothetical protein